MSLKTIRCRLVAPEESRKAIWTLMAERNTPLVNEVLRRVPEQTDFAKWQKSGRLPDRSVAQIVESLKTDPRFIDQPAWYYISAKKQVAYTFRSWLKLQHRKQWKLEGKRRWLSILQPDSELAKQANYTLAELRQAATRILNQIDALEPFKYLLCDYGRSKSAKRRSTLAYLLKRNAQLVPEVENLDKLRKRHHKTEIAIQRLEIQLQASLPKGRDLMESAHIEALVQSIQSPPLEDKDFVTWQQNLTRKPAKLPFPVIYETVESLTWAHDDKGYLLVRFQGKGTGEHVFRVYCDKTHQHWFERFLDDQETKRTSGDKHSAGLFTLRSAKLSWVVSKTHLHEAEPWNRYHLCLLCTVDTRLWTMEGTQLVKAQKAAGTAAKLQSRRAKEGLSKNQQADIRRLESTLERLEVPYSRPSRMLYQGTDNILVGISMGLDQPATVAVVNVSTQEMLAYRSTKQLLGDKYKLLNRARTERARIAHQGHRQRLKGGKRINSESQLGVYIDRLLAKAIVEVAQQYQAASIVLPDLKDIREIVEAEVGQRAAVRVPDFIDGQRRYAKAYRAQVHQWSYRRLQAAITSKAEQSGLVVETVRQQCIASDQEKAKALALKAYTNRVNVV
ncbi:hypothetical protein C7293_27485 [filamentous cyanobacterium CCT1]|nr:hypothetical protein C7293_27485 [filamentous cyanobacterium CCT1]PSN77126.1 hypothetical protein C8B47_23700 [filamentous cyanobacterium CCP4]